MKGHKVGVKGHRFLFFLTFIFIRSRLLGILVKRSLGQKSNFALAFELDGNAYFLISCIYYDLHTGILMWRERKMEGGGGTKLLPLITLLLLHY